MKTAIIFLPEAGIFPYLRALGMVGDTLKSEGYEVKLVDCDGAVVRCPMLPCLGIKYWESQSEKCKMCEKCHSNVLDASKFYGFPLISLKDYKSDLFPLGGIPTSDLENFEYQGLKIGKIAMHDLMIECKVLSSSNLSSVEEKIYREHIQNMIFIVNAMDSIIKKYNPSMILAFNPYAQCQAVLHACNTHGVKFCGITNTHHLGTNWSLYQFTNHTFTTEYLQHCNNFSFGKDIPISKSKVQDCFDDALFRMYGSGSHIFSSSKHQNPESLLGTLKLDKTKKVVGVFTSSLDERLGAKLFLSAWGQDFNYHEVFKDQVEWLKFLQNFAENRDDVQILVRIHPREGRNGSSEHLEILKSNFLGKDTRNFQVIWPDSTISSYDLFELIDCCLISSSTVGIECQRLGIPTLSYTTGISYPRSGVIETATSIEEYKKKLEALIIHKCSMQEIISSCRFYNWRIFINSLDVNLPKDYFNSSILSKIRNDKQKLVTEIMEGKQDLIQYNIDELKKEHCSKEEELEAVKLGIRKVIDNLYFPDRIKRKDWKWNLKRLLVRIFTGKKLKFILSHLFRDYNLHYSEDMKNMEKFLCISKSDKNQRFIIKEGGYANLIMNGQVYRRYSKVVLSLSRIYEVP